MELNIIFGCFGQLLFHIYLSVKGGNVVGKMAFLWYASWIISLIWILYIIKTGEKHRRE